MVLKNFHEMFDCLKSSVEKRGLPSVTDQDADEKDFPIPLRHAVVLIHAVPHIGHDNERVRDDGKRNDREIISKPEKSRNKTLDPTATELLF